MVERRSGSQDGHLQVSANWFRDGHGGARTRCADVTTDPDRVWFGRLVAILIRDDLMSSYLDNMHSNLDNLLSNHHHLSSNLDDLSSNV